MLTTTMAKNVYVVGCEEYSRKSDIENEATRIRLGGPCPRYITNSEEHDWLQSLFKVHENYSEKW